MSMSDRLPDTIQAYGVVLQRLSRNNIERVRQWRNHPEVSRHMLSADHISPEQQQAWFERVDGAADRAYYLASYKDEPTAFASVTSEDGTALAEAKTLEAAIYLAPDSRCRGTVLAFAPALALNDACFDNLPCTRLVARVKQDNEAALRFNTQMGYRETGRDDALIYLQLDRSSYQDATGRIKHLLSRDTRRGGQPNTQADTTT
jgi:RimJ/RimL family protein N-acetyltransferase